MKKYGMICAFACMAMPAFADGFYIAGDVGRDKWSVDDQSKNANVFTVAGGYKFSLPFQDTLALELGFRDLGAIKEFDDSKTNSLKTDVRAVQFSVIAFHSFNEVISAYGRLGYADVKIDSKYHGASGDESGSISKEKGFAGVGGRYAIRQNTGIYLEFNRYQKLGEVTISTLLLGADYQF